MCFHSSSQSSVFVSVWSFVVHGGWCGLNGRVGSGRGWQSQSFGKSQAKQRRKGQIIGPIIPSDEQVRKRRERRGKEERGERQRERRECIYCQWFNSSYLLVPFASFHSFLPSQIDRFSPPNPLRSITMPLIYSLVSRSIHVLAEYTASGLTGNFSTVSRVLLKVRRDRARGPRRREITPFRGKEEERIRCSQRLTNLVFNARIAYRKSPIKTANVHTSTTSKLKFSPWWRDLEPSWVALRLSSYAYPVLFVCLGMSSTTWSLMVWLICVWPIRSFLVLSPFNSWTISRIASKQLTANEPRRRLHSHSMQTSHECCKHRWSDQTRGRRKNDGKEGVIVSMHTNRSSNISCWIFLHLLIGEVQLRRYVVGNKSRYHLLLIGPPHLTLVTVVLLPPFNLFQAIQRLLVFVNNWAKSKMLWWRISIVYYWYEENNKKKDLHCYGVDISDRLWLTSHLYSSPPSLTVFVIQRGEKIELLVDKTEVLEQHAFKFHRSETAHMTTPECDNPADTETAANEIEREISDAFIERTWMLP